MRGGGKMKPVRVLFVSGGSLDRGGIASWMMNYAARFDRNEVAIDFLVHGMEPGARENDALAFGARVWHVPYRRNDPLGNRKGISQAIAAGYDVIHAHMDGMNAYPLQIAKRLGVAIRVSHSHNTDFLTANPVKRIVHEAARRQIPAYATHLFACSEVAGRFLYGDALYNAGRVTIIRNAIETERYRFSESERERLRRQLGLQERFVIGQIGRFDLRQKNQLFLLNAFAEAKKIRPDLTLMLVGDGPDRKAIESAIRENGLEHDVLLTGYRDDVPSLLSAFDLFVLPSNFEGLGIVLIEAQASGLACLASDTVPPDTKIKNCIYLPLSDTSAWVRAFCAATFETDRTLPEEELIERGYEIEREAKLLQAFYREAANRE